MTDSIGNNHSNNGNDNINSNINSIAVEGVIMDKTGNKSTSEIQHSQSMVSISSFLQPWKGRSSSVAVSGEQKRNVMDMLKLSPRLGHSEFPTNNNNNDCTNASKSPSLSDKTHQKDLNITFPEAASQEEAQEQEQEEEQGQWQEQGQEQREGADQQEQIEHREQQNYKSGKTTQQEELTLKDYRENVSRDAATKPSGNADENITQDLTAKSKSSWWPLWNSNSQAVEPMNNPDTKKETPEADQQSIAAITPEQIVTSQLGNDFQSNPISESTETKVIATGLADQPNSISNATTLPSTIIDASETPGIDDILYSEESNQHSSATTTTVRRESIIDWINPVQRVNNAMTFIFSANSSNPTSPNIESTTNAITPNEISELMTLARSIEYDEDASVKTIPPAMKENNIWWPFNWYTNGSDNSNTDSTNNVPDLQNSIYSSFESQLSATEAKLAVENQSDRNENSSAWAFMNSTESPLDLSMSTRSLASSGTTPEQLQKISCSSFGYLAVAGTKSYKNPVKVNELPISQFENLENTLIKRNGNNANTEQQEQQSQLVSDSNIVLPNISENYRCETFKSNLRIYLSNILPNIFKPQTHIYNVSKSSINKNINKKSRKIKKTAVIISIHSFLPFKMVRSLIGDSTSNATSMSDRTEESLLRWANLNNVELDIIKISIDGEGKIFERVSMILNLLDNWFDIISSCDFLIFTSFSQSVPIAIHILSRLITAGVIKKIKNKKIGLINLSGNCLGPIIGSDSKITIKNFNVLEKEILLELFDFQDPETLQYQELLRHIKVLLRNNVKISFIGSINDQFIPLYSSLCIQIDHPNIYRAIFYHDPNQDFEINPKINNNIHNEVVPFFIIHLIEIILEIKNLGYYQSEELNDLIIEISKFLKFNNSNVSINSFNSNHVNSLKEAKVYDSGLSNILNTSSLINYNNTQIENVITEHHINCKNSSKNQYNIPWCLRGFIEHLKDIKNIDADKIITDLIDSYSEWENSSNPNAGLGFGSGSLSGNVGSKSTSNHSTSGGGGNGNKQLNDFKYILEALNHFKI